MECGNFGDRLHKSRQDKGLTQAELAKLLGYKRSTSISNLESGRSQPDLDTLCKIASVLDLDLHWLITGEPAPSSFIDCGPIIDPLLDHLQELHEKIATLRKRKVELFMKVKHRKQKDDSDQVELAKIICDLPELEKQAEDIFNFLPKLQANSMPENNNK